MRAFILILLGAVLILLGMSVPAFADAPPPFANRSVVFERADALYKSCSSERPGCIAYIEGAADVMSASNYIDVCMPPPGELRVGTIVIWVENYYNDHAREFADSSAWSLVYAALKEHLTCRQPQSAPRSNSTSL